MSSPAALSVAAAVVAGTHSDPLPSWNSGTTRSAIVEFVERVTRPDTPDFVKEADRIAVFDNDGTLWSEQPVYFQLIFAIDRVRALAPQHPEWTTREPFASLLRGGAKAALASGDRAVTEIIAASHAGISTDEGRRSGCSSQWRGSKWQESSPQ